MYQSPWEIDPLEYLIRRKFPLASRMATASSPHGSATTNEHARVSEAQAAVYREELKALPPNELSCIAKEAALAEEEELRLRREREEKQRFFNRPRADMDVTHWSRMSCWSIDQAVALSLGKDPRVVKWGLVAAMLASRDFKGIRRKRLPIFMLGADHAFQASFERQTPHSPPASSGHELARILAQVAHWH